MGRDSAMWRAPGWSTPRKASAQRGQPLGSGHVRHRVLVVEATGPLLEGADHRHDRRALLHGVHAPGGEGVAVAHLLDGEADRQRVVARPHEVAVERVDGARPVAVVDVAHGDAGGHDALGEDLSAEDASVGHLLAAALEDPRGRRADRLGGVTSLDVRDGDLGGADVLGGSAPRGGPRAGAAGAARRGRLQSQDDPSGPRPSGRRSPRRRVTPPWRGPSAARPAHRPHAAGRHRRSGSIGSR